MPDRARLLALAEEHDVTIDARLAAYRPGHWFHAYTIDEMEAFYRSRLPAIREAARTHGYAIGQHGSMRRDMDLIAVPWREDVSPREELAHALARAACGISRSGLYQWEEKPRGRFAVSFPICWTEWYDMLSAGHIDLSVVDPGTTALRARLAKAEAALREIADQHIGDCPASLAHLSDEEWARRCHSHLRRTARDAFAALDATKETNDAG